MFWWRPSGLNTEQRVYLQLQREHGAEEIYFMVNAETKIEDNDETNRISTEHKKEWTDRRNNWRRSLYDEWHDLLKEDGRVEPPRTVRRTTHNLKVGRYNGTYLRYGKDGKLDMNATVAELKKVEQILLEAVNKKTKNCVSV